MQIELKKRLSTLFRRRLRYFRSCYGNEVIRRQQMTVYLFSVLLIVLGVLINMLGWTSPNHEFFFQNNLSLAVATLVVFVLFMCRRLSLPWALSLSCLVAQLNFSVTMIYCAVHLEYYYLWLINGYLLLSLVAIMVAIISCLSRTCVVVTLMVLLTHLVCFLITDHEYLRSSYWLFFLVFLMVGIMGMKLISNVGVLRYENRELRRNENSLLSLFKMEKSQLMAYVSLVQEQHRQGTVEDLLELMGEEGRRKLYESVAAYIRQEQASKDTLAQVFPELTASEKEICRLVLQGDKLKDICEKLNKSKGNITSQRVHIRSKLGLGPKDNLAEALRRRMQQHGYM